MKKLTAGIFTALLGLVTVNAANAAIPSTNYVNEHIDAVRSRIDNVETAYKNADTALGNRITTNANAIGTLTDLTTSAKGNTVAAINEVNEAIGTEAMGEIQTGKEVTDVVNPTTLTQAVNALNAKIDFKTSGIATDENLQALQNTVNGHTTSLNVLNGTGEGSVAKAEADAVATANAYTDQLANGQVATNKDAIATNAAAIETNKTAIAGKANTADLGDLAFKDTVATSDLDSTLQTAVEQVATNKSGIESLTTTVGTKADQSALATTNTNVTNLTGRVDTAEDDIEALETKTKDLKSLAYQDIIDNSDITDGTIAQAKITDLTTDLDAKVDDSQVIAEAGTVTNADAEIPTIARMNAALDAKMPLTTTEDANIGADGTYVLTATTEGGVTTYKWEQIERSTPK